MGLYPNHPKSKRPTPYPLHTQCKASTSWVVVSAYAQACLPAFSCIVNDGVPSVPTVQQCLLPGMPLAFLVNELLYSLCPAVPLATHTVGE